MTGTVSKEGAFSSDKNGNVIGSLTVMPPPTTLTPNGNMTLEVSVTYTNIKLFDTDNNQEIDIPGAFKFTSSRFV